MKKDTMKLFNLEGVLVDKMEITDSEIAVFVRNPRRIAHCPRCGRGTKRIHQRKRRRVVHDVYNGRSVVLYVAVRRFMCGICCVPFTERNIPGVGKSKFTEHFQHRVLYAVKTESFDSVAKRYKVSGPTIVSFLKANKRDIEWPSGDIKLAIDAHSFSGRDMKTTIGDMCSKRLLAVLADGGKGSLLKFLNSVPGDVKQRISEVCIDMDRGYLAAITETLPNARVVVDHFHVVKELIRKMDEMRKILQHSGKRGQRRINRFLLLKNKENLSHAEMKELKRVFKEYEKFPALYASWWVKESIRDMYRCKNVKTAQKKLEKILLLLESYEVGVLAEIRGMLVRWKPYVLNYFYNRTTNAFAEGCNNKIKVTKRISYGFRNFDNYVLKITLALTPFVFLGENLPH